VYHERAAETWMRDWEAAEAVITGVGSEGLESDQEEAYWTRLVRKLSIV